MCTRVMNFNTKVSIIYCLIKDFLNETGVLFPCKYAVVVNTVTAGQLVPVLWLMPRLLQFTPPLFLYIHCKHEHSGKNSDNALVLLGKRFWPLGPTDIFFRDHTLRTGGLECEPYVSSVCFVHCYLEECLAHSRGLINIS